MTQLPVMRELQPLEPATRRVRAAPNVWDRVIATITNPELILVVLFCAIGLLIAVNLILRYPDFGAMAEELELF